MKAEAGNSEILQGTTGDMLKPSSADGLHAMIAPISDPKTEIAARIKNHNSLLDKAIAECPFLGGSRLS